MYCMIDTRGLNCWNTQQLILVVLILLVLICYCRCTLVGALNDMILVVLTTARGGSLDLGQRWWVHNLSIYTDWHPADSRHSARWPSPPTAPGPHQDQEDDTYLRRQRQVSEAGGVCPLPLRLCATGSHKGRHGGSSERRSRWWWGCRWCWCVFTLSSSFAFSLYSWMYLLHSMFMWKIIAENLLVQDWL